MIVNDSPGGDKTLQVDVHLAARDCVRGREVGFASFNEARVQMGLPAYTHIGQIISDFDNAYVHEQLKFLYGGESVSQIDNVDLFTGGLAEPSIYKTNSSAAVGSTGADFNRGIMGETFAALWRIQLDEIRCKDPRYYSMAFAGAEGSDSHFYAAGDAAYINKWRMSDIILNTTSINCCQENAFLVFKSEHNKYRCKNAQSGIPTHTVSELGPSERTTQQKTDGDIAIEDAREAANNASMVASDALDTAIINQALIIASVSLSTVLLLASFFRGTNAYSQLGDA